MRRILPWFVCAICLISSAYAAAPVINGPPVPMAVAVVTTCGTPPYTFANGTYAPVTMDTTGTLCTASGGGGGGGAITGPLGAQTTAASVAVVTKPNNLVPLGYQQITAGTLAASTALTVPSGSTIAIVQVEAAGARYRDDGTAPSATVGMILVPGSVLTLSGAAELAAVHFILQSGSPILDISYYQ